MSHALTSSPVVLLAALVVLLAAVLLNRRIDVKVGNVHAQLLPNGGHSLRDAVDKVLEVQGEHSEQLAALADVPDRLAAIEAKPVPAINTTVVTPAAVTARTDTGRRDDIHSETA